MPQRRRIAKPVTSQGSSKYAPSKAPYAYDKTGRTNAAHGRETSTMVTENIIRRQIPTKCGCTWGPLDYGVKIPGERRWYLRYWYALCPIGSVTKHGC
jgi:hypothetical protein